MTDLHSLLTRVEAATGPDRQIDCLLDCLRTGREFIEWTADTGIVGYRFKHHTLGWELGCWRVGYTASLDAALALVEEMLPGRGSDGLRLALINNDRDHPVIGKNFERDPIDVSEMARRVLTVLLRALIAKQENASD